MESSHSKPENETISLCAPTPELTCFGCCPPIRPAGYDHLDYVGSLRREFIDNRKRYFEEGPCYRPIVGYHCWALGFLDSQGRRIGCLLHPFQNGGRDLRAFIDYGSKCMRENCLQARLFARLPLDGQRFWLPLVEGLNAFYFSSKRANPLFHLLLWGPEVLEAMRAHATYLKWTSTQILWSHPFLLDTASDPRSRRYLLNRLIEGVSAEHLGSMDLPGCFQELWSKVLSLPEIGWIKDLADFSQSFPFTHKLPLEEDLLDFVRVGLGLRRAPLPLVLKLEARIKEVAAGIAARIRV